MSMGFRKAFIFTLIISSWVAFIVYGVGKVEGEESGVTILEDRTLFTLYSENATKVQLLIFDNPTGSAAAQIYEMTKRSGAVWEAEVTGAVPGTYYGYRVWGPNWPYDPSWQPGTEIGFISDVDSQGNRFNPNKLLLDPYAKAISHDPSGDMTRYASGTGYRTYDTAPYAPKGIVVDSSFNWEGDTPLSIPYNKSIIYEVHVRGFTQGSGVSYEGTYKGMAKKIDHLKELGITAVELLPVYETINDQNSDSTPGNDNYWGYMTLNYFSPDRRYAYDKSVQGPVLEFKEMVKTFHKNGIEVILDVVFNHTAEGGTWPNDPTKTLLLSMRGIDNQVYYELTSNNQYFWDNTGCGGNLRVTHAQTHKFVVDSLKYWVNEMHVDGFRFDLASVLGNVVDKHGFYFSSDSSLLKDIRDSLPGTKIIAEPWACGDGTYQVGNFPYGWAEWNGKYRDTVRKFVIMEPYTLGDLATRMCASSDLYGDDGRKPYNSINFITAHDGFTLYDLVSYNCKSNNQAYPYGPSDGGEDNNNSKDWGNEVLRRQQIRNFGSLLLLSQGTPMILGGDEFGRTQRGNNNPYNLDTACTWVDWNKKTENKVLFNFFKGIIAFRKSQPTLTRSNFFEGKDHGDLDDSLPDIGWHGANYLSPDWGTTSRSLAFRLDGSKEETGGVSDTGDLYMAINSWDQSLTFQLPPNHSGKHWYRVIETASWAENGTTIKNNIENPGEEDVISDGSWTNLTASSFAGNNSYLYCVNPNSIVVFLEK